MRGIGTDEDKITCKLCATEACYIFSAQVLHKYQVKYYYCHHCGFLFTEQPYWLAEAYKNPINQSDTGYVQRNLFFAGKLQRILPLLFAQDAQFCDYGGGYGLLVRLMRDYGFDFYLYEPYCENLFARGFEYHDLAQFTALTSFECFEHFVDPLQEIATMLSMTRNILFSTVLLPEPIPKPGDWWYYGFHHGQHIAFYSEKTLVWLSQKYGLHYAKLVPGLYWFSDKNRQGFWEKARFKILLRWPGPPKLPSKTWSDSLLFSGKQLENGQLG